MGKFCVPSCLRACMTREIHLAVNNHGHSTKILIHSSGRGTTRQQSFELTKYMRSSASVAYDNPLSS